MGAGMSQGLSMCAEEPRPAWAYPAHSIHVDGFIYRQRGANSGSTAPSGSPPCHHSFALSYCHTGPCLALASPTSMD